jgi:hypothetical protein
MFLTPDKRFMAVQNCSPSFPDCAIGAWERVALARGCPGDCNQDGRVSVNELVLGLSIALAKQSLDVCPAADPNGDRSVSIDEVVGSVRMALAGCS